jgi:hypothetical protein
MVEHTAQDGMTVLVSDLNREEAPKTAARFRAGGLDVGKRSRQHKLY